MDEKTRPPFETLEWTGSPARRPAANDGVPAGVDTRTIRLFREAELRYWTDVLRATVYELRDAIQATGSRDPARVRAWLDARSRDAAA